MKHPPGKVLRPATPTDLAFQRHAAHMLNISRKIGVVSMSRAEKKARAAFKRLAAGTGRNRVLWQLRSKP